jgi:hypothetical protein
LLPCCPIETTGCIASPGDSLPHYDSLLCLISLNTDFNNYALKRKDDIFICLLRAIQNSDVVPFRTASRNQVAKQFRAGGQALKGQGFVDFGNGHIGINQDPVNSASDVTVAITSFGGVFRTELPAGNPNCSF